MENADVISLHCPLPEETDQMICKDSIAKMKQGVIIFNTARGRIINDLDLANALASGKVGYACIDVLEEEPPVHNSPLIEQPHCLVTPHIAWATNEALQRLMDITANNLRTWLDGTGENIVNA